jgi:hypothetical protein
MRRKEISGLAGYETRARLRTGVAALLLALLAVLTFAQPQANASTTCPPLTQGYWKNHTSVWFPKIAGHPRDDFLY